MTLSMMPEQADELANVHGLNPAHTQNSLLIDLVRIGIETAMQPKYDGDVTATLGDLLRKTAAAK